MDAYGGGRELYRELVQDVLGLKLVGFFSVPIPQQPLGWFKKPINGPDDLRGLKYRTVGLAADLFQAMGCSVAQLPGGEILPAMERGVIDAFEYSNPASDRLFGAPDVAKNYMLGAYHQATEYYEIIYNKAKFDGLSDEHKAILEYAAEATSMTGITTFLHRGSTDLAILTEKNGVTARRTPVSVLEAQTAAWDKIVANLVKDPFFAKVVDSQKVFAKRVVAYDLAYNADVRPAYEHNFGKPPV